MDKILAVAFGGSIGAVSRYLIYYYFDKFHQSHFPWASLLVNLAGSLLIGLLWGLFDEFHISSGVRLFVLSAYWEVSRLFLLSHSMFSAFQKKENSGI